MNKTLLAAALVAAATLTATAKKKAQPAAPAAPVAVVPATPIDSLSYAYGQAVTNGLLPYLTQQLSVDTTYMADFIAGFQEAFERTNDPAFTAHAAGAQIAQMAQQRMIAQVNNDINIVGDTLQQRQFAAGFVAALQHDSTVLSQPAAEQYFKTSLEAINARRAEKLAKPGRDFLAQNAKNDSVTTLPSGLQYKVLTMGTGAKPTAQQEVGVKYEGHLIDGTEFDSSYKRKDPVTRFRCDQVIKGWTEALQLMPVGSKWQIYVPYELAYGERQQGQIPAYATLIFTVELVDITPDVKAEPKATDTTTPAKPKAKAKAKAKGKK